MTAASDPRARPTVTGLRAAAERSLAAGDAVQAEHWCGLWLDQRPADSDALKIAALAALARGQVGNALSRLDHALSAAPERIDLLAERARLLSMVGRTADALACVDALLVRDIAPDRLPPAILDQLGVVLSRAHQHDRACRLFSAAVECPPVPASVHFNHASSLKFLGRFDDADRAYEACIARDPRYWKAHSGLAQLRRATPSHNHLARLKGLAAEPSLPPLGIVHLHQALAREHEDLGDHAQAFRHWQLSRQGRRRLQPYDAAGETACRALLSARFSAPPASSSPGHDSREAIFVMGMPRSGTTLVDRILSSHSAVQSAGELPNFAQLLKRAAGTPGRDTLDVATLDRGLAVDAGRLGAAYIQSTRPGTGHRPHFVDKMPLNIWYAGHIHRALPEARIVCLMRHPLDTVLSNFRQLFAIDNPYYSYADDLLDCAHYVAGFHRLVTLWQRALGAAVHVLRYETLVAEPETTIRRLLEHCRLDWEPACLHFERNAAPVSTASSVQVRQPLNGDSIGRWRQHEAALAPARALLEAEGIDCH